MTQPALEITKLLRPLFYIKRVSGSPARIAAASFLLPLEHPFIYQWFNCSVPKTQVKALPLTV